MTVPTNARLVLATLLLAALPARAQDKPGLLLLNRPKPAKPAAAKSVITLAPTNSPALSVKDIAARVKPSLVTITFTGRDGSVDGTGSGFVVAADGLIATSLHVIGEARPIKVQFADGQKFDVTEVHAWDRRSDMALIRIDAKGLTPLPLGDSDTLEQGAPIVAMGNPAASTSASSPASSPRAAR